MITAYNESTGIRNDQEEFVFTDRNGLCISAIRHLLSETDWLTRECPVFELTILREQYTSADFVITKKEVFSDASGEYLIYELELNKGFTIFARVSVTADAEESLTFLLQFGVDWKDMAVQEIFLHIPMFGLFGQEDNKWYLSACPVSRPDGESVLLLHDCFDLPLVNTAEDQKNGFSIELRNVGQYNFMPGWDQLRNCDLLKCRTKEELVNHSMLIRQQNKEPADTLELRFFALQDGWPEAFRNWKARIRQEMDLSVYEREDLKWYRKTLFQHFTFAYSKEVFDYESGTFDPEKLIADGEAVGGYDSVLLWFVYPRLGIDERSQWDFGNDVPGGLPGIRELVRRFREKNVRVFLPYNPWDEKTDVSPEETASRLCELIRATEADGFFLDTMDRMPDSFRTQMDQVRPGIVFCTEGYPSSKRMLEIVTGHWDQSFGDIFPHSHILRFLFPENNAPETTRWKIGEGKDVLIDRAIFNGIGMVLWQDVFGAWLPFSAEQKARIKKWKSVLLEHFDTFFGKDPIPLWPTLQEGLLMNRFIRDDGAETIYTVLNTAEQAVSGAFARVPETGEAEVLLGRGTAEIVDGTLLGSIDPNEVQVIVIHNR